jgi:hypothetical protein
VKRTLFTIILLFTAVASFAQVIDYGIKGGINFSEQLIKNAYFKSINSQYVTGFNVGGVVELEFQKFSIQSGVFFSTKGENLSSTVLINTYPNGPELVSTTTIIKSNYIEVPVNFLYRLKVSKALLMHFGGGPYVAYELSATAAGGNLPGSHLPEKISISYDNPDYGLNFDAGLKLKNKLLIDIDYGLGLANLTKEGTIKYRVISLSAGYMFK